MTAGKGSRSEFSRQDLAEIAVGACVMAFPAATTSEVWDLGRELSMVRVLLFALASLFFLALLIFVLHHRAEEMVNRKVFLQRVLSTYLVTLAISALLLFGLDQFDLLADPIVSLKRAILVAFPASFAATVVDSLKS